MLTEHDSSGGGEEEVLPPFLLETTEYVRPRPPAPRRFETLLELIDNRRPPYELFALLGLAGALLLLYTQRPQSENEGIDPLSASQAPSSVVVVERSSTTGNGLLAGDDPANLSANNGDRPSVVQTLPLPPSTATTAAPTTTARPTTTAETTTTTVETTTTTVETTTTEEETTTTTAETTTTEAPTTTEGGGITRLDDCTLALRSAVLYAGPNEDNPITRIPRMSYRAVATTGNWYLIDVGIQGWVSADRVRGTDGDCD